MADRAGRDVGPEAVDRRREGTISRRRFIQGAVAVSAAAGAAAVPAKAGGGPAPESALAARHSAGTGEETSHYEVLTPEQGRVLAAVLNRIVPATDAMPGAGDVGIARFIDGVLVDAPHLRSGIVSLLQEANAGERFANLREAEQDARLRGISRRERVSFDTLLRAAYTGYYSEPRVLAALGRGPGPTRAGRRLPSTPDCSTPFGSADRSTGAYPLRMEERHETQIRRLW